VGRLGGIALRAELQLEPLDGVMSPPPATACLGTSPLGDSHDVSALTLVVVVGYFIRRLKVRQALVDQKTGAAWYGSAGSRVKEPHFRPNNPNRRIKGS
jgi:hypothetical protein